MINRPERVISEVVDRGASTVCLHQRCVTQAALASLRSARRAQVEIGLVIDPDEEIRDDLVDRVAPSRITVMTVIPAGRDGRWWLVRFTTSTGPRSCGPRVTSTTSRSTGR